MLPDPLECQWVLLQCCRGYQGDCTRGGQSGLNKRPGMAPSRVVCHGEKCGAARQVVSILGSDRVIFTSNGIAPESSSLNTAKGVFVTEVRTPHHTTPPAGTPPNRAVNRHGEGAPRQATEQSRLNAVQGLRMCCGDARMGFLAH